MARGITQEQVNAAADAILGAGENPTVEKVRAMLGTGSPNTITRMLETWRGQLGARLRQLSALPELPGPVGQVMIDLWRLASEQAEHALTNRLADQQAALEAARADLTREREGWEAHLQAAETRIAQAQAARDLAEHACATLDSQLQDSHALRTDLVQQRDRLQESHDRQLAEIQALQTRHHESQARLHIERERLEAHIRAVEDRAHQEIDRARQDAKQWQQRHEVAERSRREAIDTAQMRYDATSNQARHLEQEVARQAGQITALEKALSEAYAAAEKALSEAYAAAAPKRNSRATPKASEPCRRRGGPICNCAFLVITVCVAARMASTVITLRPSGSKRLLPSQEAVIVAEVSGGCATLELLRCAILLPLVARQHIRQMAEIRLKCGVLAFCGRLSWRQRFAPSGCRRHLVNHLYWQPNKERGNES